jgi:CMP/dCMP kinase
LIITISGLHGTGKSTYAAELAKSLGLRHVSAGMLFRRLAKEKEMSLADFGQLALKDPSIDRLVDDETMREAEKGDVVIDGQLSGWVLKEIADLRIYLTAPDDVRLERIAQRDRLNLVQARRETLQREKLQTERYMIHYGLKVNDSSVYHMVMDTSLLPMEGTAKILLTTALAVKAKIGGKKSGKP